MHRQGGVAIPLQLFISVHIQLLWRSFVRHRDHSTCNYNQHTCIYIYMYLLFINIGWVRRRCGLVIPLL